MAAWAMEESAPPCLRREALRALVEQYYLEEDACSAAAAHDVKEGREKKERVAEVVWWCMASYRKLSWRLFQEFWNLYLESLVEDLPFLREAVRELGQRLGGIKKEQLLLQQQQSHLHLHMMHFLDDPHVAKYKEAHVAPADWYADWYNRQKRPLVMVFGLTLSKESYKGI
ncbi:hypothetical protein GOP47_0004952 [Adiantum capillus-veneris]|uniref:Uncharacterized protein n=1 Tax=Adiantum capillus-veneris TaxID=13818 RepID=A0A9D4V5B0_ADICA|nr:hypothetical protein GOP47_0004952 [Adiantum capillus-veneris]